MMNLKDKRVLVFGTGISGIAAANLLQIHTDHIVMFEGNKNVDVEALKNKLGSNFKGRILIENISEDDMENLDLVVLSPGVPTDLELVNRLRNKKLPIIGEIELAYMFSQGKIVGITGTNGKTTTTTLVGKIMETYYEHVYVVGNIGLPYTNEVTKTTEDSVTVAELSSFQLETIDKFKPDVSAILNITPDHLNRHHSMDNYIEAKKNIAKNQDKNQVCVLNYEDDVLRKIGESLDTRVIYFSSKRSLADGVYLEDDKIRYNLDNNLVEVCNVDELNIFGTHSYENVMAAVGIAYAMNVPLDCIRKALKEFVAVEHRIEYVATKSGVKYYNDSKGTNPDASIKAIESMKTKTVLIAGGYDKNSEYEEWILTFKDKIKTLVVMGQTKEKIKESALKLGFTNIIDVESMEEAVNVSAKEAKAGECVLLSPACASWGMFKDYEERGNIFKACVHKLA